MGKTSLFAAVQGDLLRPVAVQEPLFAAGDLPPAGRPPRPALSRGPLGETMSQVRGVLRDAPEGVGARWAAALARRYPAPHAAKRIARDFAVEPRTAQAWLAGQAPQARHLCMAAVVHGPLAVFEVLAPGADPTAALKADADLALLERRLAALREDIAGLRRGA